MNQDTWEIESARPGSQTRYRNRLILFAAISAVLLALLGLISLLAPSPTIKGAGTGAGPTPVPVDISPVTIQRVDFVVSSKASVVPTPEAWVSSDRVGWVRRINVKQGQKVESGQLVALIQPAEEAAQKLADDYRAAQQGLRISRTELIGAENAVLTSQSAVAAAEERLVEAKFNLTAAQNAVSIAAKRVVSTSQNAQKREDELIQTQKLFTDGAVSRDEVERARQVQVQSMAEEAQARGSLEIAQSQVKDAEAVVESRRKALQDAQVRVTQAQKQVLEARKSVSEQQDAFSLTQARLQSARRKESQLKLDSPVDGVVSEVIAKPGILVTPTMVVLRINRPDVALITMDIPISRASRLRTNMPATIQLPGSEREIKGRLVSVEPSSGAPEKLRTVSIEVRKASNTLRPGRSVNVQIVSGSTEGIVIPKSALVRTGNGYAVWIEKEGVAVVQPVRVIQAGVDKVVIADGLGRGTKVILSANRPLREGIPVRERS